MYTTNRIVLIGAGLAAMAVYGQAPRPQFPQGGRQLPAPPASTRQLNPEELNERTQAQAAAGASAAGEDAVVDEAPGPNMKLAPHPGHCKPRIRISGRLDNFAAGPVERNYQSPVLQKFLTGKAQKPYDSLAIDTVFGTSFPLGTCKLCGGDRDMVIVEASVRRRTVGTGGNDKMYVHVSNDTTPAGQFGVPIVPAVQIWTGPYSTQLTRIVQFQIPVTALNNAIWAAPGKSYLEVVLQDDTGIDYVRMIGWAY